LSCEIYSPLGQAMTCSADKTSRIWNLGMGECLMVLPCSDSVTSGTFDSTLALCGCADNTAILFDVSQGALQAIIALIKGTSLSEENRPSLLRGVPVEILQNIKGFLI
jgi:WD40 repeat protein